MILGMRYVRNLLLAGAVLCLVSCHGFFTDPILKSIAISPGNPIVTIGATQQFTATGVNDDGSTATVNGVTWSSSSTSIATIDGNGLATGVAAGTSTITATSGSITGTTTLTVSSSALSSIAVTAANPIVSVGGTDQMTATATFADNTTKNITSSATWQTSNSAFATVNSAGVVTGVAAGTVTITASSGNISGQVTLQVQ